MPTELTERLRKWFESQPQEFYGGNNLQRDGNGYDSSYVHYKWLVASDILLEIFNSCDSRCSLREEIIKKVIDSWLPK